MFKIIRSGNERGFTLIELLVVIAIIGILGGIAIPMFLGQRTKAMRAEADTNVKIIATANENFYAENGRYAPWPNRAEGNVGSAIYKGAPSIESDLRGVKFGDEKDLKFKYTLTSCEAGQAFLVKAEGKPGTPVDGVTLYLNQKLEDSETCGL